MPFRIKKTRDELNKATRLQDFAVDIINGNYSDEKIPNLLNITCSSVATLNVLDDQKRSQSLQSLNNGISTFVHRYLISDYQSYNGPPLKTYGSLADLKKRYDARKKEQPKRLTLAQRLSASCQTLTKHGSPKFPAKQLKLAMQPVTSK